MPNVKFVAASLAVVGIFIYFVSPAVAGASVSPVVWVLPERRAAAAAFHATVPPGAPVEPPVRQRSQRPSHLRLHRGPAAGHLQPGEGRGWGSSWVIDSSYFHWRKAARLTAMRCFKCKTRKTLEKSLILTKWKLSCNCQRRGLNCSTISGICIMSFERLLSALSALLDSMHGEWQEIWGRSSGTESGFTHVE